jgi:hypothetical protein
MNEIAEFVNIRYSEFIRSCENSWLVYIDEKPYFFPYSLCNLDEDSMVIRCPMWFAIQTEVEQYEDED